MKKYRVLLSAWLVCFAVLVPAVSRAIVYLDITSAEMKKLSVAIPAFVESGAPGGGGTGKGQEMADLVAKALIFHGFVSVIPASSYHNTQDANWASLGADYAVLCSYGSQGGEMALESKVIDVHANKTLADKRYVAPWAKARTTLLKLSDDVIFQLSGEEGVSNTDIAFVSNKSGYKEVWVCDVLGDHLRQVTRHHSLCVSPRFSPDGGRLAYTSYHRGNPDLYVTDLSQSKYTKAISWQPGLNMAPAWAADGQTMIVTLSRDSTADLYRMTTNGRIVDRLTKGEGINTSACWSPDGRRIAFTSDRSGTPQIYIMDVGSRQTQRLTFSGKENTGPSWSPKGDLIAYTGRADGGHQIFVISPDGGEPKQVTQYWGNYDSPSWAPDGRQLVVTRDRGPQQKDLCRIFLKGGGLTPLFPNAGRQQAYPQWSPRLPY